MATMRFTFLPKSPKVVLERGAVLEKAGQVRVLGAWFSLGGDRRATVMAIHGWAPMNTDSMPKFASVGLVPVGSDN